MVTLEFRCLTRRLLKRLRCRLGLTSGAVAKLGSLGALCVKDFAFSKRSVAAHGAGMPRLPVGICAYGRSTLTQRSRRNAPSFATVSEFRLEDLPSRESTCNRHTRR